MVGSNFFYRSHYKLNLYFLDLIFNEYQRFVHNTGNMNNVVVFSLKQSVNEYRVMAYTKCFAEISFFLLRRKPSSSDTIFLKFFD